MKVAIGADHGGFQLKEVLKKMLVHSGHQVIDLGTDSQELCDYPVIGAKVASKVSAGKATRGILLCKSGGGMAIVANKFPRVRAVVAQSVDLARHSREHNDANVLVLGARGLSPTRAQGIVKAWLATDFAAGRHARRVRQIAQIERSVGLQSKT